MTTEAKALDVRVVKPGNDDLAFGAGERIILVDGVRWGRTFVDHHGMHGTSHTFRQDGGVTITEPYDPPNKSGPRMHAVVVRIGGKRRDDKRPTDVQVQEKAADLVRTGKLRDPDAVKAEREAHMAENRRIEDEENQKKKDRFKVKAREALGHEFEYDRVLGPKVLASIMDRIVEAMEWAQSQ